MHDYCFCIVCRCTIIYYCQSSMALKLNRCTNWITWIFTEASDANYFSAAGLQIHWRVAESDSHNVSSGITYLMKHLICTICSSHKNDHRTSSIDSDLHKLMNTILCELKNLKNLLSLSPLITINNILSGVLAIIAFYLTFYVGFFYYIVLYGIG